MEETNKMIGELEKICDKEVAIQIVNVINSFEPFQRYGVKEILDAYREMSYHYKKMEGIFERNQKKIPKILEDYRERVKRNRVIVEKGDMSLVIRYELGEPIGSDPRPWRGGKGGKVTRGRIAEDSSPSWDNAIRQIEDSD